MRIYSGYICAWSCAFIKLIKEKDDIKNPNSSGYCSLHLVVSIPVPLHSGKQEVKCEIQLRTTAMDTWAALEHNLKYKKICPMTLK